MQLCSLTEAVVAATQGLGALGGRSGGRGATKELKRPERTREELGVIGPATIYGMRPMCELDGQSQVPSTSGPTGRAHQ